MDRRSFFRSATVGAGATALSLVGSAHAKAPEIAITIDESEPRRTAVSVVVTPCSWEPTEINDLNLPSGFVPRAISACDCNAFIALLDDDDAPLMDIDSSAFAHGPLDLWRDVRGTLRCRIEPYANLSYLPIVRITIYGEIPRA